VVDAPTRYAKHEGESCWTHDYLLRHSEQYRVDLPGRHLGYVEDIVFPPGESEPIGFLVRGDSGLVFVSVRQIRDFSPRAQRGSSSTRSRLPGTAPRHGSRGRLRCGRSTAVRTLKGPAGGACCAGRHRGVSPWDAGGGCGGGTRICYRRGLTRARDRCCAAARRACESGRKTCVRSCACSSVSESLYGCSSAGRSSHTSCVISHTRSR
jgi:hypothetical protein